MLIKRWQDWVTLLAGIWFVLAPWILGQGENERLLIYNSIAVGSVLVLFSGVALSKPDTGEEVVDFLIGLWAFASPWLLGYQDLRELTINAALVGLFVTVLSAWTAMERGRVFDRFHTHGHA